MAKKARKKVEEKDGLAHFRFPPFDEAKFILYELEQSSATAISIVLAVLLALATWRLTLWGISQGIGWVYGTVSLVLGIAGAVALPFLVGWVRERSHEYKRGDWAMLLALYVFLWLGLWTLLLNL
jgi:fucose permease